MQNAVVLSPPDFDRLISEMKMTFMDELKRAKAEVVERPLTRIEAAQHLSIKPGTLDKRIKTGIIPVQYVHYNGGTPYFFASELNKLLKERR